MGLLTLDSQHNLVGAETHRQVKIPFADEDSEDEAQLESLAAAGEATAAALIRQEAEGGALLSNALLQCMSGSEILSPLSHNSG